MAYIYASSFRTIVGCAVLDPTSIYVHESTPLYSIEALVLLWRGWLDVSGRKQHLMVLVTAFSWICWVSLK